MGYARRSDQTPAGRAPLVFNKQVLHLSPLYEQRVPSGATRHVPSGATRRVPPWGPVSSQERWGAVGQAAACGATCSSPLNFPSRTEPGEGCKPRRAQTCCTSSPVPGRVCVCAGTLCAGSLAGSQQCRGAACAGTGRAERTQLPEPRCLQEQLLGVRGMRNRNDKSRKSKLLHSTRKEPGYF